jgi:hypothetical protein
MTSLCAQDANKQPLWAKDCCVPYMTKVHGSDAACTRGRSFCSIRIADSTGAMNAARPSSSLPLQAEFRTTVPNSTVNEEPRGLTPELGSRVISKLQRLVIMDEERQSLIAENRALRETLSFTQRVVEELLSQNKAYYDLLGRRRSKAVCTTKSSKLPTAEPIVETFSETGSIGDIWLVSPSNEELLGEAEAYWKKGEPQKALAALTSKLQTLDHRRFRSLIKVRLLSAAILQNRGVPQGALEVASECLAEATKHRYWDLMGVSNFLRGRCQIDLGQIPEARQSLLFAAHTPGYAGRVRKVCAMIDVAGDEISDDDAIATTPVSLSLPPIRHDSRFVEKSV